jgi:hypothetical protein
LNTLFDVPNTNDFTAVQWVKGYPVKASISSSVWQSNENFCNWIVANDEAGEGWK